MVKPLRANRKYSIGVDSKGSRTYDPRIVRTKESPMTTPDERLAKLKRGIRARQDAIKALIANHQVEFDEMHQRNRVELGLPLRAQGPTREELKERIRRQEEKLEKWREELERSS
jgi:hypothetical protein